MRIFLRQNILILFFLSNVCVLSQTLVINEISQGPSGSKEYVEFLVVPTGAINPCQPNANCLDLRGWIFDDNNSYFTPGSTSGVGLAQGSLRFSNSAFWSCIPVGTLITTSQTIYIYDEDITIPFSSEQSFTVTVHPLPTISLTSDVKTDDQTICENSSIVDITYNVTGFGSNPVVSNLPDGIVSIFNS